MLNTYTSYLSHYRKYPSHDMHNCLPANMSPSNEDRLPPGTVLLVSRELAFRHIGSLCIF